MSQFRRDLGTALIVLLVALALVGPILHSIVALLMGGSAVILLVIWGFRRRRRSRMGSWRS